MEIKTNGMKKKEIRYRKWKSKVLDKPSIRNKQGGKIIPKLKYCKKCNIRKVKYHHSYCNKCWLENRYEYQTGIIENVDKSIYK